MKEKEFDQVFKIMEESFPLNEYRTYEEQKALLKENGYQIDVHVDETTNQIDGFLASWDLGSFIFIEHLAVSSSKRNQGIGLELLSKVLDRKKRCCLEVEIPSDEYSSRRIQFYNRNGFFLNEYPYIQPSLSKGREVQPLLIMTTGSKLAEDEFERIKNCLYQRVYKVI